VDDDGLVWKEVLYETEAAYTPTPAGPVKRPFKIIAEGDSDFDGGIVSMEEVAKNFDSGAVENVQAILGSKQGGDHEDITRNSVGFVRKVRMEEKPGTEGKKRLMAGIEFTEPDIKGKVERGTFANCSAGLYPQWLNKHTGTEHGATMRHLSITNHPWVEGMDKFGAAMLADDEEANADGVIALSLTGESVGEDIVWDDRHGAEFIRSGIQKKLEDFSRKAAEMGQQVFYWVKDIAPDKEIARIVQDGEEGGGLSFVVPYRVEEDEILLESASHWTPTRSVMVAAADELTPDQLKVRVTNALGYSLGLGNDYEVKEVGKHEAIVHNALADKTWKVGWEYSGNRIWLDPTDEWRRGDAVEPRDTEDSSTNSLKNTGVVEKVTSGDTINNDTPEGKLLKARMSRGLLSNKNEGGKSMSKIDMDALNLSDEQRAALEQQIDGVNLSDEERDELATRRADDRQRKVDDKIKELSDMGLSENPGVLKYLRRIYASDDGQPSVVLLADEDGATKQEATISQAFDGFLSLLRNQEGTRIELSSQHSKSEEGVKPADDTTGEVKSIEDQLTEAADTLGLPQREPVTRK
jgi:hypothetical protein